MMADMFEQMSKEEQEIMIELAKRMRTEKPEKLLKEINFPDELVINYNEAHIIEFFNI